MVKIITKVSDLIQYSPIYLSIINLCGKNSFFDIRFLSVFYTHIIQFWVAGGLEPIPAGVHPGRVASPSQGHLEDK